MEKPDTQSNGFHLGFFKGRIAAIVAEKAGVPSTLVDKQYFSDILQALSERTGVDLSDFPIGSRDAQLEMLARSLHQHYLKKFSKKESTGPPQTPL